MLYVLYVLCMLCYGSLAATHHWRVSTSAPHLDWAEECVNEWDFLWFDFMVLHPPLVRMEKPKKRSFTLWTWIGMAGNADLSSNKACALGFSRMSYVVTSLLAIFHVSHFIVRRSYNIITNFPYMVGQPQLPRSTLATAKESNIENGVLNACNWIFIRSRTPSWSSVCRILWAGGRQNWEFKIWKSLGRPHLSTVAHAAVVGPAVRAGLRGHLHGPSTGFQMEVRAATKRLSDVPHIFE